jgi:hypothetical protein
MSTTTDTIRLVLLAFFGGLALPLMVQLFLTLRTLQRTSLTVERRIDETSREVHEVLAGLRREPAGPDLGSVLAGAAVPAVIAAIRAFRSTPSAQPARNGANAHEEKTS